MNKKLMAMAVAGAFAVPAAASAATSNVQIYGRAQVTFDSASATGATAGSSKDIKSRNRVDDNSSRLGFKGTENLGGGLKAIFKMESGVNLDTGGSYAGGDRSNTGTLASREGWVGLAGNWGAITLGKQNVWWTNFTDQTQANYINEGLQYATGGSSGGMRGPTTRTSNDVKYSSPMMNGFRFWLNYAPQSENAAAGASTNASISGVSAAYFARQFIGEFNWAKNQAAGSNAATRTGTKLGLGWKYQRGAILSLILIRLHDENIVASSRSQNAWQLNWSQMNGNWQWIAQLGGQGNVSNTSNTGSKGVTLSAKYHFSKRTGAYVSYTKVTNEANGTYDYHGGGNPVGVTAASAGADPQVWGVGIQHNF